MGPPLSAEEADMCPQSSAVEAMLGDKRYHQYDVIGIVDDDPGIRDALDLLLSSYGYRTELFATAEEFIIAAGTTKSTCLLVDIELGDITGIELGHKLVAMGYDFPVIFMTGSCDAKLQKQALNFGCTAFLHKPFQPEQLIESILRATERP
jgi:FixJ family two-component response regulator